MKQEADICWWVGFALIMVQMAESALGSALAMVFPLDGVISVKSLDEAEDMSRRVTLGRLLTELRRRSEIRQDFDDILTTFLASRNEFIHRFTCSFDLGTPEGQAAGIDFCKSIGGQANFVACTLMGAVFTQFDYIADATGAPVGIDWETLPASTVKKLGLGIIAARNKLGRWQGSV